MPLDVQLTSEGISGRVKQVVSQGRRWPGLEISLRSHLHGQVELQRQTVAITGNSSHGEMGPRHGCGGLRIRTHIPVGVQSENKNQ